MPKKKTIAFFLSLLLLVFFSNNLAGEVYTSYGKAHTTTGPVINKQVKINTARGLSFNTPKTKSDHIKVRYMGGDCSFDASQFPININAPEFADTPLLCIAHCFFISNHSWFLFKLRGPPYHPDTILS